MKVTRTDDPRGRIEVAFAGEFLSMGLDSARRLRDQLSAVLGGDGEAMRDLVDAGALAVAALEDQCRQLRVRLETARAYGQAVVPDDPRWDKVFADLAPIEPDWATERAKKKLLNPEER